MRKGIEREREHPLLFILFPPFIFSIRISILSPFVFSSPGFPILSFSLLLFLLPPSVFFFPLIPSLQSSSSFPLLLSLLHQSFSFFSLVLHPWNASSLFISFYSSCFIFLSSSLSPISLLLYYFKTFLPLPLYFLFFSFFLFLASSSFLEA